MPRSIDNDSSSSSSSGEDDPRTPVNVRTPTPASRDDAYADLDSPGTAQQSSDESTSSDVVLVDLPGQARDAQESRCLQGDPDGGILVNIDGTMQENTDTGREDTFVDAPDQLSSARSLNLGDSLAVIEFGESSTGRSRGGELAEIHGRLDEALAECRKYKEEREVFGREVAGLRHQLQGVVDRQSLSTANNDGLLQHLRRLELRGGEDDVLSSPTPLHSMVGDCSNLVLHLKSNLDEQLSYEGTIRELHAVLYTKDQEIEDLNGKISELDVSHGIVFTYLGSLQQVWSESHVEKMNKLEEENRKMAEQLDLLRGSLEVANAETSRTRTELEQTEGKLAAAREKLSIAVSKGKSLVQHRDTLKQSLAERTAELENSMRELQESSNALTSIKARAEGLQSELERHLLELQEKSDALVSVEASSEELRRSLAEKNGELERYLLELDQKSGALETLEVGAEELKKSLAEKESELERCLLELQQRSEDLDTAQANADKLSEVQNLVHSLQDSLANRDGIIRDIEEAVSQDGTPQELLSMDIVDQVRWFVNQKHVSDGISLDNHKIRDALSSINLPETISTIDSESQIHWLGKSLAQAKGDLIKLQDEIANAKVGVASHASELSEAHEEVDRLAVSLLEERRIKDSVRDELEDLRCKYENMTEKLSSISSEKDGLLKVLVEVSESTLEDQPFIETNTLIEKFIVNIRERIRSHLAEREHFDKMKTLLYVKTLELVLCEDILEETMTDRYEMENLSTEVGRASEEIVALRNERDSLQLELERVEDRSSQLRERLSLAVRKGKGLVQERDGLKHSLDEKNAEVERLNEELQLRDSAISTFKEQVNNMSTYPEQIQKLESDIISLKDQRDEMEQLFQASNSTLQSLLDSVESIVLPATEHFEGPMEKVNWIAELIHKSEAAKIHAEQELELVKEESSLQVSRLADAFATIKSLEDQLFKAEKEISVIAEEKKNMQVGNTSIEQELEKMKEEHHIQVSKLADAYTTIKSLEDALSNADSRISLFGAEKTEAESRSRMEINTLNAKLAECTEELAKTRNSLENQSDELVSHIGRLQMLMKDESLLSLMTEEFRKKIETLRNMGLLIQNIHEQLAEKGLQIPGSEQYTEFAKEFSLPQYEDFIKNRMVRPEMASGYLDDVPSFTNIVEGFHAQATLHGDLFKNLSRYMDDHIAHTVQALQLVRDEFNQMLELSESLKVNTNNLEAQNEAQEVKIVSLQKEIMTLLSACTDATQELQIEFHDLLDLESDSEQGKFNFSLGSRSEDAVLSGVELGDAGESSKAAKSLLLAARRIRIQFEQLANIKRVWITATDDLKNKLKQAELTAETAIQERQLNQEIYSKLEGDLEALQNVCSEMQIKIDGYQVKEDMLRDKEAELLSLQHTLTAKHRGLGDELFSEDQMESIIDKINSMEIPSNESKTQSQEVHFSSPYNKLFYILDRVIDLQHRMNSLTHEKEDMRLILASHVHEIDELKNIAETTGIDSEDLESKKIELIELTVGLERIIQRLGGNYSSEDQKTVTAKGLLPVLERVTNASTMESEKLKSRIQELAVKLQEKEKVEDELSAKVKFLEGSLHARLAQPDTVKERSGFESSTTTGSEISEIEDVGPLGKKSISPAAAHVRTMRKGSTEHLVLNIDPESERLISTPETDDKGHFFKSLNASGLIPKQGKSIADRIDGIWVSGGRILMSRPGARLGLIAYWLLLHIWLLGAIL